MDLLTPTFDRLSKSSVAEKLGSGSSYPHDECGFPHLAAHAYCLLRRLHAFWDLASDLRRLQYVITSSIKSYEITLEKGGYSESLLDDEIDGCVQRIDERLGFVLRNRGSEAPGTGSGRRQMGQLADLRPELSEIRINMTIVLSSTYADDKRKEAVLHLKEKSLPVLRQSQSRIHNWLTDLHKMAREDRESVSFPDDGGDPTNCLQAFAAYVRSVAKKSNIWRIEDYDGVDSSGTGVLAGSETT